MASPHRNIYIVGAQCTGKTTLVNALERHFTTTTTTTQTPSTACPRPVIVREVARSVLHDHNFSATDIRSSPARALELQTLILQAQVSAERRALDTANWFISDRSGVDAICYARTFAEESGASLLLNSEEWRELRERIGEALVIVCESGADWLDDDGVRLMPLDRDEWIDLHKVFCSQMDDLGLSYVVLPAMLTDLPERVNFVLSRMHPCGGRR
ncbi:AAA domain-containing protein [Colletotrichum cereale]|nr:AAA domain-containing protein [Colletotrichum cereale]